MATEPPLGKAPEDHGHGAAAARLPKTKAPEDHGHRHGAAAGNLFLLPLPLPTMILDTASFFKDFACFWMHWGPVVPVPILSPDNYFSSHSLKHTDIIFTRWPKKLPVCGSGRKPWDSEITTADIGGHTDW